MTIYGQFAVAADMQCARPNGVRAVSGHLHGGLDLGDGDVSKVGAWLESRGEVVFHSAAAVGMPKMGGTSGSSTLGPGRVPRRCGSLIPVAPIWVCLDL